MYRPCPTCPFLEANRGKPTPTDFKCLEHNLTDWYSQENIDGMWKVMRLQPIAFLSCHTTDPDYYGAASKDTYACLGATYLIYIHTKIYEQVLDYNKYEKIVGRKYALLPATLVAKNRALITGRVDDRWGDMKISRRIEVADQVLRLPKGFQRAIKYFKQHIQNITHEQATTHHPG